MYKVGLNTIFMKNVLQKNDSSSLSTIDLNIYVAAFK